MESSLSKSELQAEKEDLQRKLAIRERFGSGWKQNCAAIRARLAEIDRQLASE